MTDGIVLLHGIGRTKHSMRRLEKFLQNHGYDILNISYPSTRSAIEDIADIIHAAIDDFAAVIKGRVHLIGYSMGGLVIRAYLHKHKPENLGRVVMLGTPNNGSEVADFVRNWWPYRRFYGPAAQQLLTTQDAFRHIFGKVDFELGSIAGVSRMDPLCSWIIRQPNDGKVSVASTKLDGMADHVVIKGAHTFLADNKAARQHIIEFLRHGRFKKDSSAS